MTDNQPIMRWEETLWSFDEPAFSAALQKRYEAHRKVWHELHPTIDIEKLETKNADK